MSLEMRLGDYVMICGMHTSTSEAGKHSSLLLAIVPYNILVTQFMFLVCTRLTCAGSPKGGEIW